MAFYIKPPNGYMQLASIESIIWQRFHFLLDISKCHHSVIAMKNLVQQAATVADSDCLIEGSQKDQVTHFLLRLACAQDPEMEKFFLCSETWLFSYRFSCMTKEELITCMKPLRRFLHSAQHEQNLCSDYQNIVDITNKLTEHFNWKSLIAHFVKMDSNKFVYLSFVHVMELVRKRSVVLDHGVARVPCSKLCDIMTTIFRMILNRGMEQARQVLPSVMGSDSRIAKLFKCIEVFFHNHYDTFPVGYSPMLSEICCEEIDKLVDFYPPCMTHLHKQLRRKHRLKHFSRIQYTLYLKEMGLPVHEALQFWRAEYAQEPMQYLKSGHGCHHNWKLDGRRYTYSIRHLYGLEGARINYRGHCCRSIQNQALSHEDEGGCPFKHFDQQHLVDELLLGQLPLDSVRTIMKLSRQDNCFNKACQTYMKAKLERKACCAQIMTGTSSKSNIGFNNCQKYMINHPEDTIKEPCIDGTQCVPIKKEPVESKCLDYLADVHVSKTNITPKQMKSEIVPCDYEFVCQPNVFYSQFEPKVPKPNLILQSHISSDLNMGQRHLCQKTYLSKKCGVTNEQEIGGTIGCYDHHACPKSQLMQHSEIVKNTDSSDIADIVATKPIDYFVTYRTLLDGMK